MPSYTAYSCEEEYGAACEAEAQAEAEGYAAQCEAEASQEAEEQAKTDSQHGNYAMSKTTAQVAGSDVRNIVIV